MGGGNMTKQKFVDTDTKEAIEEQLKVVNHQTAVLWAIVCSERIIQYFEQKYPQDNLPIKAIEAGREADDNAAIVTDRAAGPVVSIAHVFGHAIHESTYVVKSVAYATKFDAIAVANYSIPNLFAVLARARSASISRSRGLAFVTSVFRRFCVAIATSSTARLITSSFAFDGLLKPETFRTYCSEAE